MQGCPWRLLGNFSFCQMLLYNCWPAWESMITLLQHYHLYSLLEVFQMKFRMLMFKVWKILGSEELEDHLPPIRKCFPPEIILEALLNIQSLMDVCLIETLENGFSVVAQKAWNPFPQEVMAITLQLFYYCVKTLFFHTVLHLWCWFFYSYYYQSLFHYYCRSASPTTRLLWEQKKRINNVHTPSSLEERWYLYI